MEWVFKIAAELISLLRLNKESKVKEVEIKNQEDFKKREEKQQDTSQKDKDEKLISEVVAAPTEEERKAKLDEIRKIISK